MKKQVKKQRVSFEDKVVILMNSEIEKLEVKTLQAIREIVKKVSAETGYNMFSLAYMYGVA
jgi:hypothetical protein